MFNPSKCGEPAAQSVYSNFTLLLCEEPIAEPEAINMGIMFGEEKFKTFEAGEDGDASVDIDDQLYFPLEEKVNDISKNIRDLIHVELTISAVCDPNCRGLCLKCDANLNNSKCSCRQHKV
ncbi:large ribosomal RNA subunit accumulation protein YCED 1, chloroplastic-like [Salvia divinorum]